MKISEQILTAVTSLFMLVLPATAAEYQGKNIDNKKIDAKAYYYATGGVYEVQVSFKQNRATIYFNGGYQTTIQLKQPDITDPNEIEGFGKLGQISLSNTFSIGLEYDSNLVGDRQLSSSPLEGFWKISLDASELKNLINQ
ncbi:hypothetical protein CEN45_13865 [Fischerella thermalis CCMEE 5198]|uniref:hypothetical protein n=1 Tax=Fischerella thermalis TaxID=372787 RepID=UPI000C80DB7D|nr:hypothetical protein [Fischerella thermalis]PLZ94332.1 hypothetical protein CI594_15990 [Fischerella thermalis CCMEE 5196]PMB21792.1 hypothetical protein CEN45_13865 [Fischerella thermalis CCMEE 5198]